MVLAVAMQLMLNQAASTKRRSNLAQCPAGKHTQKRSPQSLNADRHQWMRQDCSLVQQFADNGNDN
jgi:hypothetical protein